MPTRDYMVVHARHDHSMRVPRPDLSVALGTPNACTQCHRDKSNQWAADAALKWWGDKLRKQRHYGQIIHAGREDLAGAQDALAGFVADAREPAIRRATAASLLGPGSAAARALLERSLADPDPLVRHGALMAVDGIEPGERIALVAPLLHDPVLTVRIEAARALVSAPKESMSASERSEFEKALGEYVSSQGVDADRAEAHANLGVLHADQGDLVKAEEEYRAALALTPALAAATANLADLYRSQGRDAEAEAVLRRGLAAAPRDPGLHHALGLALVRMKRMPEALKELEKAATLPPERARYAYVYGVALESAGRLDGALEVLTTAHFRHPGNREILEALASFTQKAGNRPAAIGYARQLVELDPQDAGARKLLEGLTRGQ
jgi:tetratricopeptide (TPR) repeat protein